MAKNMGLEFNVGDAVVYPAHGVGKITAEEVQVIGGAEISLYVISFAEDKMTLRVPKSRVEKAGLRKLSSTTKLAEALSALRNAPKSNKKIMWSKRAADYETRMNSGDPVEIASVLFAIHSGTPDPEHRSYSETMIYDDALNRLASEYSLSAVISKEEAKSKILDLLDLSRKENS